MAGQAPVPASASSTASAPDSNGVYRIGNGVSAPKVLYQPEPEFSDKARQKKVTGTCGVSLVVDTDGQVRDVKVVRSIADGQPKKLRAAALSLDEKAVQAVRQYRFEPAMFQGRAVAVMMTVEVSYQSF